MKNINYNLFLGLIVFFALISSSCVRKAQKDPWCQEPPNLSQAAQYTVHLILEDIQFECQEGVLRKIWGEEAKLTEVTTLNLDRKKGITDISPLSRLNNLDTLFLSEIGIADISYLSNLTKLESLYLSENNITNIIPLAGLANLEDLVLRGNQISDVSPLANLTNLRLLSLSFNNITNIEPLAKLNNLEHLGLGNNQISNIQPLSNLSMLKHLDLDDNRITNLSPIVGIPLEKIRAYGNPLPANTSCFLAEDWRCSFGKQGW